MNCAIVCVSFHHQNTIKIAEAMAKVLRAKILKPEDAKNLGEYDLVGFGSGIYYWKHDKRLFELADGLPQMKGKKAFIFSTSGLGGIDQHKELKSRLVAKGYEIVGEFGCEGLDTIFLLQLVGGKNKGRPNEKDLKKAEEFANSLKKKL